MHDALYGPDGFYLAPGTPGRHFRTSPVASPLFAAALRRLAEAVDDLLGRPEPFTVVDMAAGGGELVAALAAQSPPRWRLCGVDLAARPQHLPPQVGWSTRPPAPVTGLVVANEWLDNVPVDVVEVADDGVVRVVEVADDGAERLGDVPADEDRAWLRRWWPLHEPGERAEVGRPRDEAWAGVVRTVTRGVAVAVDYRARPQRQPVGTLTGFRDGRQVAPVPDGRSDLTAHVLLESCAVAGEAAGARASRLLSQHAAVHALAAPVRSPPPEQARRDPLGYLRALSARGELAELTDPAGLGGFGWLVQAREVALPDVLGAPGV